MSARRQPSAASWYHPVWLIGLGVVLMALALLLPSWLGGRAAIDAELQTEIRESARLHDAISRAHAEGGSEAEHAELHQQLNAAQEKLMQRVEQASQRGQTVAWLLRWSGIALAAVGVTQVLRRRAP